MTETDNRVGYRRTDIGTHYHGYCYGNWHSSCYKTNDDGCNGAGRLDQCSRQDAENQSDERVRRKHEQRFEALPTEYLTKALANHANCHEQNV